MKQENLAETDFLVSREPLDPLATLVLAQLEKRVSQDSRGLRVVPVDPVSLVWATQVHPVSEETPGTLVSLVCPGPLVTLERKAPICPAVFPARLETPVILESRDDQVLKGSLGPLEDWDVLVLTEPKEKKEILATEDSPDPKVFLDPEATPVSQEEPGQVLMEPGVRTVCPDVLELKVSLERYWVLLVGLPEWTASLGPLETRASLGTTEDLVQLDLTGALESPELRGSAVWTVPQVFPGSRDLQGIRPVGFLDAEEIQELKDRVALQAAQVSPVVKGKPETQVSRDLLG